MYIGTDFFAMNYCSNITPNTHVAQEQEVGSLTSKPLDVPLKPESIDSPCPIRSTGVSTPRFPRFCGEFTLLLPLLYRRPSSILLVEFPRRDVQSRV